MKKSILSCSSLFITLIMANSAALAAPTSNNQQRASILQTQIAPYLQSQDTQIQYQSSQEQLTQALADIGSAQDLLYDPAVPYASEIDFTFSKLLSIDPYDGQNQSSPLLTQINDSLIPYLQAALDKIGDFNKIIQIACGGYHTLVLTSAGAVYATGLNTSGQLGIGNNTNTNTLTAMTGEGASGCTAIAAGYSHSLVLKDTGAVYATGANSYGELGTGNNTNTNTLTAMTGEGTSGCTAIAAGGNHSLVLKDTGDVYATGLNDKGQLGTGNNINKNTLTAMTGQSSFNCAAIAAGENHSLVLMNTGAYNVAGAVYGTGDNNLGQLGIKDFLLLDRLTAANYKGTHDCIAIATGRYHTVVFNNTGAVYATGDHTSGQLGIGNGDGTYILKEIASTASATIYSLF